MSIKSKLGKFLGVFLALFLWEHICRQNNIQIRPSPYLFMVSNQAQKIFTTVGVYIALVSSFYTYIKVDELLTTLFDLVEPLFKLATSGFYIIKGYTQTADQYRYPIAITLGTATILFAIVMLFKKKPNLFTKLCCCCKRKQQAPSATNTTNKAKDLLIDS